MSSSTEFLERLLEALLSERIRLRRTLSVPRLYLQGEAFANTQSNLREERVADSTSVMRKENVKFSSGRSRLHHSVFGMENSIALILENKRSVQAELPTRQCGSGGLPIDAEWLTQGSVPSVSDAGRSFSLRCLVIGGLAFGERGSCRSFTYD